MPEERERIAVLETHYLDVRRDVDALGEEQRAMRTRLHNLEGFAQAYLDVQKQNRRQEDSQYRRLSSAVQVAGLMVALGMLLLSVVTIIYHS